MTGAIDRIRSFDLSPDGSQVLLAAAEPGGGYQPWLIPLDGSPARSVPVDGAAQRCVWRPDGSQFIVEVDLDGREDYSLAEVDPGSGELRWLAAQPGVRNQLGIPYAAAGSRPYSPDGRYLAFATNRRADDCFDVVVRDLRSGSERTVLTSGGGVPDDRYFPMAFSPDSRQVLVLRLHQNTEHELYAADLGTGAVRLLTPQDGPAKYQPVGWRDEGIYLCATRDGNFTGLGLLRASGQIRWIDTPDHDIEQAVLSADGSRLAWAVSQDGFTALRHCRIRDGEHQAAAAVPGCPADGSPADLGFAGPLQLSADGQRLFVLNGRPGAPPELRAVDLDSGHGAPLGHAAGTSPPAARRPDVVRFRSTDGLLVSGLLYRPAGDGPCPAVLHIHGGPEAQALPSSEPLIDMLVARGIAVLAPNIRGSSGYGLRYQRLIYRDWGGGDVDDLRAAAEFLRSVPWVDPARLAVYGASYGGFASLSCLTRLPEYWHAGVSECGVTDLVADVRTFPPTWRRRARDWVGDPDDPGDHRRMTAVSPLSHVDRIRAPVLLVHGTNDTRAAIDSTDSLHARMVELGLPVRYERIEGAGHEIGQQGIDVESLVCDWLTSQLLPSG